MTVSTTVQTRTVDVVFDGPPGPVSGRFVELEDSETGESLGLGEWVELRREGCSEPMWALRLEVLDDDH